jgi:excisionase family DNA binding protein
MENETTFQLHTIETIGERTALSRTTLHREIKAGRLRTVKIGRALRVSETELQRYIASLEQSSLN